MFTDLPSQLLLIDGVHPDQLQPRRSFQLAEHETLKADMAVHGQLQPILVRRDQVRKHFVIVVGERRWRCAKELGWKEISARVIERELTPAEILTIQLMENLARESLNPVDEARSLERLQGLLNCSREELAAKTHRSPASICRSFKLLELPVEVQSLVETGQLPVSIAAELHRCSSPALQRELAQKVAAGELTRDEVTASVKQAATPKPSPKAKTLTWTLPGGISVRMPAATSVKDCAAAFTTGLRQLREAKRTGANLTTFIEAMRTAQPTSVTNPDA